MMLLADQLGYVQLAEPVRFTAAWERAASLRLRADGATALDEYDQHGRIRGDLIHLGLVDNGRTIRIADGAEASAGDLIICRANDHGLEAGEPGRRAVWIPERCG